MRVESAFQRYRQLSQKAASVNTPVAMSQAGCWRLSDSDTPTRPSSIRLRAELSFRRSRHLSCFTSDFARCLASIPRSLPRFSLEGKPAAAASGTEAFPASHPPSGMRVPCVPQSSANLNGVPVAGKGSQRGAGERPQGVVLPVDL